MMVVATAVTDPGHGVPTPDCEASLEEREIFKAQVANDLRIRLGEGRPDRQMTQAHVWSEVWEGCSDYDTKEGHVVQR